MATTNGKQQAAQAPAGARRSVSDDISGTYSNPEQIREMLAQAEENYILFGGLAQGDIPDGFSVMLSVFKVNPDNKLEVYTVDGGLLGLGGLVLKKLADAAGISIVDSRCLAERLHYCHWQVAIARQCLDGSVRRALGSRTMNLREDSGTVAAMRRAADMKNNNADNSIWGQRLHIQQHAETKAFLRAVRGMLGVGTYSRDELLKKPIAVAKLQLTGRSNNPQTAMMLTVMMAQQALSGMAMLYGGAPAMGAGMPQMGGGQQVPQMGMGSPGPMIFDPEDDDGAGAGAAAQPPPPPKVTAKAADGDWIAPYGKLKDCAASTMGVSDLEWYAAGCLKSIGDPDKAKYKANNERVLRILQGFITAKKNPPPASTPSDDGTPSEEDFRRMQDMDRGDDPDRY